MKTRTRVLFVAVILSIMAVFLTFRKLSDTDSQEKPGYLAEATQAAFIRLDAKFVKCTTPVFLLGDIDTNKQIAPLFDNLGDHHFPITTTEEKAQVYFDQGIRLTYAFNHAEAHRSFMEAARLDPSAAMAYWGQAFALGPNINDPFPDDERKAAAYQAAQQAKNLSTEVSSRERDLIDALTYRYSEDPKQEIEALNQAYMQAMKKVWEKYPQDAEVQTLFADAVMNTQPWNYWDKEGNPNPNIPEAKAALEKAMELDPDHPGAHHYYIHMVELPKPDLAIPSAEKLGKLMPGAGHLVHMPAHIFIRVGRYQDAAQVNINAIAADEDYLSQCYSQGMYPLGYYPHNIHFLWSSASLLGNRATALDAARKTAEKVPVGEMAALPFLQDFASTPMLAYTRFGQWNEILTIPYPGDNLKHLALIWHYTRGIAFLRKNNIQEAEEELEAIATMQKDPEMETIVANTTNSSSKIAHVAYQVLQGEIAAAKGNYEESIAALRQGVTFEDDLNYNEPPAWHIPVRQTLGAVLLKAGQPEEAAAVYQEDLIKLRQNGWSLMGLYQSLKAQGKMQEAKKIKKDFDEAWARADIQIETSIL